MGTNYYLHENPCPHCKHPERRLHVGKSSGGWCFSLHVLDAAETGGLRIQSLADWEEQFRKPGSVIVNEYGDTVSVEEMLREIKERKPVPRSPPPDERFLRDNEAEIGPKGLLRHRLGRHCVAHGEGTWDMIAGYFQ